MKTFIQCGYEHKCKNKNCLKCPRKTKHKFTLTLAEEIVIEDFSVIDLEDMFKNKPKQLELMQHIMFKVMKKVFKNEKPRTKRRKEV